MTWPAASNLSGGQWQSWTPLFKTGTDLWDASNMTYNDCRFTVVEGTVYAVGNFVLAAGTNYGNGTEIWQLFLPSAIPAYADADTGARLIGRGFIYDNADPPINSAILDMNAVNTFNSFFYFNLIRYTLAGGGNWNGGNYNRLDFKRSELSSFAGGSRAIYCSWYMRYIGETGY